METPMPSVKARPRYLVLRFMVALVLAMSVHLLLIGFLAIVVEMGAPSPPAEIMALTEVGPPAQDAKVSKLMPASADSMAVPPPASILDFSTRGTMTLPPITDRVPSPTMTLGAARAVFSGGGGMGVPAAMKNRFSSDMRLNLLMKTGGLPGAEDAVQRALHWLVSVQNADGSWGRTYKGAMTGLAVLCFLGHGETPESAAYGRVVRRGVGFLTLLSAKNAGMMTVVPRTNPACYEHGIATYALGEVYALARFGQKDLGPVAEAFDRGVRIILEGQTEDGGWLYNYHQGTGGDVSVTGWQYQALKAARQTRLRFPTLEAQIRKTERFLLRMRGPRGGFGYQEPADKASLTGAGVLGLQMFDHEEHRLAIIAGLQVVLESYGKKRWAGADVYAWYYNTQAAFNFGGAAWDRWNAIFQKEVLENQQPDGHWHHASARKAKNDSDIFCTTLCTLMLEVFYRYQPPTTR